MKHMRLFSAVLSLIMLSGCSQGASHNNTTSPSGQSGPPIQSEESQSIQTAYEKEIPIQGTAYLFDAKTEYTFSEVESNDSLSMMGLFSIDGEFDKRWDDNGIPSFSVASSQVTFSYRYIDTLLNASEESWHLISDSSKTIDDISLESKIEKGAIILQTSKNGKVWYTEKVATNVFEDTPIETGTFYQPTSVQLSNGCYYRLIVAYETERKVGEHNVLFVKVDDKEQRKQAEVYTFFLVSNEHIDDPGNTMHRYELGEKYRVKTASGYVGKQEITSSDPHYGWDIGTFFVSGFTERIVDESSDILDVVFLKNVGDKVTLGFNLNYDINALNGNSKLSVVSESGASDQEFQTTPTDFKKGALIIRYRDYTNKKSEPQIYTNYLEASVSPGADTTIQLCEEGDYEVVLDYEIVKDKLIDERAWYRIRFNFKVRNSNCMVFPFDVKTHSELTNGALTENGFYLDLANSRYLTINLKKEVMTEGADGLTMDTRFNGMAKDGVEFTDEGVYTITVQNKYTHQETVKKIYVGTNSILKAYVVTGISIPEIRSMVSKGAVINADGSITESTENNTPETSKEKETEKTTENTKKNNDDNNDETDPIEGFCSGLSVKTVVIVAAAVIAVMFVILIAVLAGTRKRDKRRY